MYDCIYPHVYTRVHICKYVHVYDMDVRMYGCVHVHTYIWNIQVCHVHILSVLYYFSWCSFYTCPCTFLQIPATMEIGLVPPLKKGQYPGLFLMTSPARMVRPVLNLATNTQEMIGSFEQVIFGFVSRLFLSSRKGPGLHSLHTCMNIPNFL